MSLDTITSAGPLDRTLDDEYEIVRREARFTPTQLRQRRRRRRVFEILLAFGAPIVLVAAWQWAANSGAINPQFFPPPTDVWDAGVNLYRAGTLVESLSVSLTRVFIGCLIGVAGGVAAGVLLGTSKMARVALEPLLSAMYTVPKLAILPLLLLIFGLGEEPIYLAIGITVFFFMWMSTMAAFLAVSEGYREAARTFRVNRWQMFRHVLFPAALPQMFIGLRLSVGIAVLMMVGVEFTQSSEGIGHLIWYSWTVFRAPDMYVGIVVVALLGLLLTTAVKWISVRVLPWARTEIEGGDRSVI